MLPNVSALSVASVFARLPDRKNAERIISRHRKSDRERVGRVRERFNQLRALKAEQAERLKHRAELAGFEQRGMLMKERAAGWDEKNQPITERVPDPALQETDADLARIADEIEMLRGEQEPACLTADRIETLLAGIVPNAAITECAATPTLKKGEAKPDALARVRSVIVGKREERDDVARKTRTAAEMKQAAGAQIAGMVARGLPKVRGLLEGGELEFASTRLPKTASNFFHSVPDGAALVAFFFESEMRRKIEELIDFNVNAANAMPRAEQERQLAALDAELLQLRREEAALVEAIVVEGGSAWHFPDAPIEAVLSISTN